MKELLIFLALALPVVAKLMPEPRQEDKVEVKAWTPLYADVMSEIKRREGLRLTKYKCPAGVETIGYGFTGDIPDTITVMLSIEMLHDVFDEHYVRAQEEFPQLKRNQHLAIAMLTYNIGWSRFRSYKLYQKIKDNGTVWNEWYSIRYFRKPSGQMTESENLKKARLFELELWQRDAR